jgi:predicted RNase H-like nuclease (RuvC/YqgF family)
MIGFMSISRPLLFSAALGVAGASMPALAQSSAQKSFGQGKASGRLLTRAELRACFTQRDRLRDQADAAQRERDELDREKAELVQQGNALKEQLAALDRDNAEAVAKYNADAAERDRRIDAFEAKIPEFNRKAEALQAERSSFSKQCDNRRYDELDEAAIKNGK